MQKHLIYNVKAAKISSRNICFGYVGILCTGIISKHISYKTTLSVHRKPFSWESWQWVEFFPLNHVAVFKPFKEPLEKYHSIRNSWERWERPKKQNPCPWAFILCLPFSLMAWVYTASLSFTGNMDVEDVAATNTVLKGNYWKAT